MSAASGVCLAPSLLAADFADLGGAAAMMEGVVDVLHVDVMDGHFVPNIAMGPAVVSALRPATEMTLDVHLMVDDPDRWVGTYRDAGADWISVHYEAGNHLERTLGCIRESGARAGLALNPGSFPDGLQYLLGAEDFVVVMSVNPGFGGQRFLPAALGKISALRGRLDAAGLASVQIEVDGGVDRDNAADCVTAGADILVAGSSVFRAADPREAAEQILQRARAAAG